MVAARRYSKPLGNGAVAIHDFEFALAGATTESVARYIREGQFGLWEETGWINEAAVAARDQGIGWGEAIGRMVRDGRLAPDGTHTRFLHADVSLLAACADLEVPFTIHPGIGYDIIHEHPNFDGAVVGEASYTDFLIFARSIERLEVGVVLNVGSAVIGPEVYLKALAMARNVAHQEEREIRRLTTAVFLTSCPSRVTTTRRHRRRIRGTSATPGRLCSCAPLWTAGRASTSAAITVPLFRRSGSS